MKPKLIALSYDVYMTQREAAQYHPPLPPAPEVNAGQLERSRGIGSVSVFQCYVYDGPSSLICRRDCVCMRTSDIAILGCGHTAVSKVSTSCH